MDARSRGKGMGVGIGISNCHERRTTRSLQCQHWTAPDLLDAHELHVRRRVLPCHALVCCWVTGSRVVEGWGSRPPEVSTGEAGADMTIHRTSLIPPRTTTMRPRTVSE